MKQLVDFIETIVKLDQDCLDDLYRLAEIEVYKKNQFILKAGQYCNKIWFLKKGMVRKYHLHNEKEITTWIHLENDTFTSLVSYSRNQPSDEYLQACEDTETIGITRQNSEKLVIHPQFVLFSNTLMAREMANIDIHTKELAERDARGKYEYLRLIAPEMVKRAKLGYIASVLGLSQETLSRVRK